MISKNHTVDGKTGNWDRGGMLPYTGFMVRFISSNKPLTRNTTRTSVYLEVTITGLYRRIPCLEN
jgi:hypothetical protein